MPGYRVDISSKAEKELKSLPKKLALRIGTQMMTLADSPRPRQSKKLRGTEFYRIRVSAYRVVYAVFDTEKRVIVLSIAHRRDIYRHK